MSLRTTTLPKYHVIPFPQGLLESLDRTGKLNVFPSRKRCWSNRSMLRLQIDDDVVRLVGKIPRKKAGLHLLLADKTFHSNSSGNGTEK
jgi:hypothetical protein